MIISFETAVLAKEVGFDPALYDFAYLNEPLWEFNRGDLVDMFTEDENFIYKEDIDKLCYATSQVGLQDWLRETHNIIIEVRVDRTSSPKYSFEIHKFIGNPKDLTETVWGWSSKTSELLYRHWGEALEVALKDALGLVDGSA